MMDAMTTRTDLGDGPRVGVAERSIGLDQLEPGMRATVRAVGGESLLRRRLMEMGFVSGTPVRVVRLAPLGDPMEIELHGYHISLRHSEAQAVLVRR